MNLKVNACKSKLQTRTHTSMMISNKKSYQKSVSKQVHANKHKLIWIWKKINIIKQIFRTMITPVHIEIHNACMHTCMYNVRNDACACKYCRQLLASLSLRVTLHSWVLPPSVELRPERVRSSTVSQQGYAMVCWLVFQFDCWMLEFWNPSLYGSLVQVFLEIVPQIE